MINSADVPAILLHIRPAHKLLAAARPLPTYNLVTFAPNIGPPAFLWLTKCPMKIWQGAFWHNLADVLIKFFITFPFPALKGKTICTRKLLLFSFAVYFQILKQMQGYIEEAFDETLQTKTFVASKQDQGKLTTNKSVLSPMVIWLLVNRD